MNDLTPMGSGEVPFYAARGSAYGVMTPVVQQFFARLMRLPLETWIRTSTPKEGWATDSMLASRADDGGAAALARAKLRRIMDEMPSALGRAKRRVHDITDCTAGFAAEAVRAPMTRAALTAALALVARPHLTADEFRHLYGPFAELIPVESLELASRNRPGELA